MIVRNAIRNPSFETGTHNWSALYGTLGRYGWNTSWVNAAPAWLGLATSDGTQPFLYLRTALGADDRIAVAGGQWVGARTWYATDSGMSVLLRLQFYDAAGSLVLAVGTDYAPGAFYPGNFHRLTTQAPAGSVSFGLDVIGTWGSTMPAGKRLWVDAVQATVADTKDAAQWAVETGYHDGDSLGWAWEGTPHASTSFGPAEPYTPEAEVVTVTEFGETALDWLDLVSGYETESESGVTVTPLRLGGSNTYHVTKAPAGPRTGRMVVRYLRELATGTTTWRSAVLEDALRSGDQLRFAFDLGLAPLTVYATGGIARRREPGTAGQVWTVEFDYSEVT